jgi:Rrf2 family cysteine metabolism transcriptional repressor
MKRINRDTDYAVRALLCMAKLGKEAGDAVIPVEAIVAREGLPRVFLRRLLQQLAREKILNSHRGKGGGFSFRRRPDAVSLYDIMNLFQGPIDITNCVLGAHACPRKSYCKLRARLRCLNERIAGELRKITIEDLI